MCSELRSAARAGLERPGRRSVWSLAAAVASVLTVAGCATAPQRQASIGGSHFDPRLGVSASERVVFGDDPVPRGGGAYLVGHPYTIAGRAYFPNERPQGYTAVGTASWYGDAFHGRRTANGEVFDRRSISAAHPTLPLPSYVRVTNLGNGHSMIVRVNDRGPYHGNRVMDVSQRVAEALDFRQSGTARIRIDYIGRAGLDGSDDDKLMASLRTDGVPAEAGGFGGDVRVAAAPAPVPPPAPGAPAEPMRVARETRADKRNGPIVGDPIVPAPQGRSVRAPLPPARPFEASSIEPERRGLDPREGKKDQLAILLQRH